MRMRQFLLLIFTSLLLFSCAQLEGIEGGPVDSTPPRMEKNGVSPKNGSTHFSSKKIQFKFEEFVRLNNPSQTISIVPEDIKIEATLKGKTLSLELNGQFKENTTYVITMNGAVRDITEANDSLMQYVFSTGDYLDSLTYTGFVMDAKKKTPVNGCFVGLYPEGDSAIYKKPTYYATTDEQGQFTFRYLTPGTFTLYAFEDGNKDSKWQKTERIAFIDSEITVDTNQTDTLHLRLFQQVIPTKLSVKYTFPAKFTLSYGKQVFFHSIKVDGRDIPLTSIHWYTDDSLSFISHLTTENNYQVIANYLDFDKHIDTIHKSDTVNIRAVSKIKNLKPSVESLNAQKSYDNGDSLIYIFSDNITSIDTSKVELLINDSIRIPFQYSFENQHLKIKLSDLKGKRFNLNILEGALQFEYFKEAFSFTRQYEITDITSLGALIVKLDKLPKNTIVEVIHLDKVYKEINVDKEGTEIKLEKLTPGTYTFVAYIDENNDGKWTTGDFIFRTQPERVLRFSSGVQVRSNWEIEVELEPLADEYE